MRLGGEQEGAPYWFDLVTELLEVNVPITIEVPAGTQKPGLPEGFPLYSGMTLQAAMGGLSVYETTAAYADVPAFYKEELPKAGWTLQDDGLEMDTMAMLTYLKESLSCQVTVNQDEGKVSVMVSCEAQ